MEIKFAVFNPATGEYTKVNTFEEAASTAARLAVEFYFLHTHSTPVAKIIADDAGAETWTSPDGTEVPSQQQIAAETEAMLKHRLSFENAEAIPVTKL